MRVTLLPVAAKIKETLPARTWISLFNQTHAAHITFISCFIPDEKVTSRNVEYLVNIAVLLINANATTQSTVIFK